ncbi:MAG TPA: metallophosphoesterase [Mycobacteriales bacterium]|nr:metallophosphoesterase [Mycobacteriales bacterium]
MRARISIPLGILAAGAATTAYATVVERTRWTLRRFDIPVLEPGSRPLTILHLSDFHMTADQRGKQRWIRRLDRLEPDLVLTTGDNIASQDAVAPTLAALGPLRDRPGAFIFGSNDYYEPRPRNPLRYFFKKRKLKVPNTMLPWEDLRDEMVSTGWLDLNNNRGKLKVDGRHIALAGVDDPHIKRDRYQKIAGPADPDADLRIALTHSPEPRILDRFTGDGYELILAGHTHGGQLRVPFYGALVTNCGIDRARCRWVSRWNDSWLHVSAGLGTSPYAPVRFACPPEATLLTLVPRA